MRSLIYKRLKIEAFGPQYFFATCFNRTSRSEKGFLIGMSNFDILLGRAIKKIAALGGIVYVMYIAICLYVLKLKDAIRQTRLREGVN